MQRKIDVGNGRIVLYSSQDGVYQIRDIISDRFGVISSYVFTMGKDYKLSGYTINNDETEISFEISNDHPLYMSFMDILYDGRELIINDDSIKDNNRKYLRVFKSGESIILKFVNNLTNDKSKLSNEKFNILVRGNNSKVDQQGLDTKERLYDFFDDVSSLMNGYSMNDGISYVKKRN